MRLFIGIQIYGYDVSDLVIAVGKRMFLLYKEIGVGKEDISSDLYVRRARCCIICKVIYIPTRHFTSYKIHWLFSYCRKIHLPISITGKDSYFNRKK